VNVSNFKEQESVSAGNCFYFRHRTSSNHLLSCETFSSVSALIYIEVKGVTLGVNCTQLLAG
jgi:hypothetical protein